MFSKFIAVMAVTGLTAACVAGYEEGDQIAEYEQKVIDCNAMNGVNPTKAALAVAMGSELGRWKATDLEIVSRDCDNAAQHVRLKAGVCGSGGCPVTTALLQLTNPALRNQIDQNVFNPVMFCQDLIASFDRQKSLNENMAMNHAAEMAPADYTLVNTTPSEPVEACGQSYWFDAQAKGGGSELANPESLEYDLCFFGEPNKYHDCGRNPWVSFKPGTGGKVVIDPLDSDLGGTGTAGSCTWLPSATATAIAGMADGACCTYPLAGQNVMGTVQTKGTVKACSIVAMKQYDPPTKKYLSKHCSYVSGGVTYKGKFVNNVLAPSYDICDKNLAW